MARRTTSSAGATAADETAEPAPATVQERKPDSLTRVRVYDTVTGEKLPYPVPLAHLDGRFPRLKQVPSTKRK